MFWAFLLPLVLGNVFFFSHAWAPIPASISEVSWIVFGTGESFWDPQLALWVSTSCSMYPTIGVSHHLGIWGWFYYTFIITTFSYCSIFLFLLKRTWNKHKLIIGSIWRNKWGLSVFWWWLNGRLWEPWSTPSFCSFQTFQLPLPGHIICLASQAHA